MATYTCTTFLNTPKAVHIGNQSVSGIVKWGAASSVGDIAFLAKIPHGASIVDIVENHSTGASAQALSIGFDRGVVDGGTGNLSIVISSGAQATVNRINVVGAPIHISVSDTDPLRYAILEAKVESGTATTSLIMNFTITYRTDGS